MTEDVSQALIMHLPQHVGKAVCVRGWLRNKRSGKNIHFLILRDGTGEVQCVASGDSLPAETMQLCDALGIESSLEVVGIVREDARSPGGYEVALSEVKPLQVVNDFPISKKEHGVEFLMEHRHLWLRSRRQVAILRIRDELEKAWADFFYERGFARVDAPIFTPAACEGTTTLFDVDYHGDTAYLTQSGQLYNEATIFALGRVYCFGPTFRAEKSKTRRHLLEFWMLEMEAAFFEQEDNLRLQEELLVFSIARVLQKCGRELATLQRDTDKLVNIAAPFPRLHYRDAVEQINRQMPDRAEPFRYGDDFGAPEETFISQQFEQPVFVTNFPVGTKAFYMKPDPDEPDTVLAADLLAPEGYGEIVGGSQREDDLDALEKRVGEHGLPREAFQWYFDLRRYGSVPHSGFGLGLERTLAWLCGLSHIREAIPFPRMLHHLYP
ncbi:MAG: asparagine--tRNA ligase [Planctomycetales bacterium 4484_113]|nr:MAG: asparagine--tRNA ligase [Planctomycetales bacterium 4484_113]